MPEPASLLELIRFGYGPKVSDHVAQGGVEPDRVLAQLTAPDPLGEQWTRPGMAERYAMIAQGKADKAAGIRGKDNATYDFKALEALDAESFTSRPAVSDAGFVERLVNAFANRLTISNASGGVLRYMGSFRDEAIRPNVAGRFAEMLKAALWHPGMLVYLTQTSSVGPNSSYGKAKGRGLNENLAREFLELHSMGAGYSQADITELARLLAGMQNGPNGPEMDSRALEPGVKTILGETFRDEDPVAEINRLVELVAQRPETADSVAFMLARHFIADVPPPDLVQSLAAAYRASDGQLRPVYETLLHHPASHAPTLQKLRSPQEFVAATLRALGLQGQETGLTGKKNKTLMVPAALARMGQPPFRARRPDGWPEVAEGWMTPPMMAARIDWAVDLGRAKGEGSDPSALARHLLGDLAAPDLHRAVAAAEQRWEGLALLLASPDFMRR
jgi:uncharacterized protein (DUF1800 family)